MQNRVFLTSFEFHDIRNTTSMALQEENIGAGEQSQSVSRRVRNRSSGCPSNQGCAAKHITDAATKGDERLRALESNS